VEEVPKSTRLRSVLVAGLVVLIGLYLASPYYALWRLRAALDSGDRSNLEARIDFPSVRESMKNRMQGQLAEKMKDDKDLQNNPFAAVGNSFGDTIINTAIDNLITPGAISSFIADTKSAFQGSDQNGGAEKKLIDWSKVRFAFFTGPTRFTVNINDVKLHLGFNGLGWKLKDIEFAEE